MIVELKIWPKSSLCILTFYRWKNPFCYCWWCFGCIIFSLAFCFVCCSSQLKIIGISGNQPSGQICSDWGSTFLQRNSNKSHFSPKPCPRWALVGARTSPVFEPKSSSSLSNYLRLFTSKVFRFHSRFLIAKVRGFVLYGASQTFRPGALSLFKAHQTFPSPCIQPCFQLFVAAAWG